VKFMFSVMNGDPEDSEDSEDYGDRELSLNLEYVKGELPPRFMSLWLCSDCVFGYWYKANGTDPLPFAIPGHKAPGNDPITAGQ
jgi:hypothetical protein